VREEPCTLFKGADFFTIQTALKVRRIIKTPNVYVDAKILNMHDPGLPREAYVGYLVEGSGEHNARKVEATESDDAEVLAILFAIEELKDSLGVFTIVCDHESVVSEANREGVKNSNQIMEKLRGILRENRSVHLRVLQANPAHGIVTAYVNAEKTKSDSKPGAS
jgi:ribonuclease HI